MSQSVIDKSPGQFDPYLITRPSPQLMTYYFVTSLFLGPFFWVALLPLWFRYTTLRYKFDEKGISMSWGMFFKREILLTYRRIQDIHLTRGIIQRWMGLATVSVQTASGNAQAEMSIEGILEAEALRDFLYTKMRGARGPGPPALLDGASHAAVVGADGDDEALVLLREIRDALAQVAERGRAGR